MITCKLQSVLNTVAAALRTRYGGVTIRSGQQHNFLGINWDFRTPGEVSLNMDGYVKNIITKYHVTKKAKTPATESLSRTNNKCAKVSQEKAMLFHSCVMELHYLAKRIRGDILTAVSFCATRVLCPDNDDIKKLGRILSYLLFTKNQRMILRIGEKWK